MWLVSKFFIGACYAPSYKGRDMSSCEEFYRDVLEAVNPNKLPEIESNFFNVVKRWKGSSVYLSEPSERKKEERQKLVRAKYQAMLTELSVELGICKAEVAKLLRGRPKGR